jgi:hypothetical protein
MARRVAVELRQQVRLAGEDVADDGLEHRERDRLQEVGVEAGGAAALDVFDLAVAGRDPERPVA